MILLPSLSSLSWLSLEKPWKRGHARELMRWDSPLTCAAWSRGDLVWCCVHVERCSLHSMYRLQFIRILIRSSGCQMKVKETGRQIPGVTWLFMQVSVQGQWMLATLSVPAQVDRAAFRSRKHSQFQPRMSYGRTFCRRRPGRSDALACIIAALMPTTSDAPDSTSTPGSKTAAPILDIGGSP